MLEGGECQTHTKVHILVVEGYLPSRRHLWLELPLATLLGALVTQKRGVGTQPLAIAETLVPDGLWLGAAYYITTKAFELLAITRVEELIIGNICS